jgi:hypothetical protein
VKSKAVQPSQRTSSGVWNEETVKPQPPVPPAPFPSTRPAPARSQNPQRAAHLVLAVCADHVWSVGTEVCTRAVCVGACPRERSAGKKRAWIELQNRTHLIVIRQNEFRRYHANNTNKNCVLCLTTDMHRSRTSLSTHVCPAWSTPSKYSVRRRGGNGVSSQPSAVETINKHIVHMCTYGGPLPIGDTEEATAPDKEQKEFSHSAYHNQFARQSGYASTHRFSL